MNIKLFRELTEAHGVASQEDQVRSIVIRELKGLCDISVDTMGSVIAYRGATTGVAKAKKLMLAAHMDEIGFVVSHVSDKGFLRIVPLGGWDPRMMAAQRVVVRTASGDKNGVLMPGVKPKHLLTPEEAGKALKIEDFFVDLGMDGETAKATVQLGDQVTMDRKMHTMGDLITNKAMDDRAAVFVMIEAVKKAASHGVDLYAVATVQEEIGLRGAVAAGSAIKPDICVAIDITLANDIPGIPDEIAITRLGQGTAIKFMDSSLVCNPKVFRHFVALAVAKKIAHQIEVLPLGGTDAGGVQRQNGGTPSFTLSIPTRYVHTVNETVHKGDVSASIDLLAAYIEDAHNGDYEHSAK